MPSTRNGTVEHVLRNILIHDDPDADPELNKLDEELRLLFYGDSTVRFKEKLKQCDLSTLSYTNPLDNTITNISAKTVDRLTAYNAFVEESQLFYGDILTAGVVDMIAYDREHFCCSIYFSSTL